VESSFPVAQIDYFNYLNYFKKKRGKSKQWERGGLFLSSVPQSAITFNEGEEIEPKTVKDAECQTFEFDYMFLLLKLLICVKTK